jgi:hypothetical protein
VDATYVNAGQDERRARDTFQLFECVKDLWFEKLSTLSAVAFCI